MLILIKGRQQLKVCLFSSVCYPLFLPLLLQFVPAERDEGFIILIPLLQPRSAQTRLLSDGRINGSMANTIKNKYSCNELSRDSGHLR